MSVRCYVVNMASSKAHFFDSATLLSISEARSEYSADKAK